MLSQEEFISFFSEKILNNEAALFVAAGLSQSAGYCSWKDLLQPCAQSLKLEITDETDLYQIAQYYANTFGDTELRKNVSERINQISKDSDLIAALLCLGIKDIWTTNFDTALEQKLLQNGVISSSISHEKDLSTINEKNTTIFKLNGDISNPDEMILTKKDYSHYFYEHEMFLTFLKRDLATKTFLFVGYSFKDSLILDCMNQITRCFKGSSPYHYTILKEDNSPYFKYFVDDLEKRYHIRTVVVKTFNEIPDLLRKLEANVKNKKVFISGSFDWFPQNKDNYADHLSKVLVESILGNHYRICTGLGRKFGNYISGHAYQYCLENKLYDFEKYLIMRPFHELMNDQQKTAHRQAMISECNIVVFAFGKSPSSNNEVIISRGVLEEFAIAKEQNKFIIPLATTGYATQQIFQEIRQNMIHYPYLERYMSLLEHETDIARLCKTVMAIINDINQL